MTVTIDLSPEEDAKLQAAARREGVEPADDVKKLPGGRLPPVTDREAPQRRLTSAARSMAESHTNTQKEWDKVRRIAVIASVAVVMGAAGGVFALQQAHEGYKDTPMLPGNKWHVHDPDRPLPTVVTPGTCSTQKTPGTAPSDAIVLFDGKDLSQWQQDGHEPTWVVDDGTFHRPVPPAKGGGNIFTKDTFGDVQLHVEFQESTTIRGAGQGRGNSGVFFHDGIYEVQVLDSYDNATYADGSAASIYGQHPPLVNASRKPGEWQMYDIVWIAPRFQDGKVASPAYVTMFHNGVLVHNHTQVYGPVNHRQALPYKEHPFKGHIGLQDHGNVVKFRNVWVREVKDYDAQ